MTNEQPMPVPNERPLIQNLVIDDLHARLKHGIETYGTGLQAGNGRDARRDAYEEAMDLTLYLRQLLEERAEIIKILDHLLLLHYDAYGLCAICTDMHPCHTAIDIDRVLGLLGAKNHRSE